MGHDHFDAAQSRNQQAQFDPLSCQTVGFRSTAELYPTVYKSSASLRNPNAPSDLHPPLSPVSTPSDPPLLVRLRLHLRLAAETLHSAVVDLLRTRWHRISTPPGHPSRLPTSIYGKSCRSMTSCCHQHSYHRHLQILVPYLRILLPPSPLLCAA